jgi:uncharacterized protein (DUF433 family)
MQLYTVSFTVKGREPHTIGHYLRSLRWGERKFAIMWLSTAAGRSSSHCAIIRTCRDSCSRNGLLFAPRVQRPVLQSTPGDRTDGRGGKCWTTRLPLAGNLFEVRFPRISTDPDKMGGVPCIRDLRFPVATVVGMVADGMSFDEILTEHPDLEEEDIREALRYAAEAVSERELPLRAPA